MGDYSEAITRSAGSDPLVPQPLGAASTRRSTMAVSDKAWGGFAASDYSTVAAYARACLINLNEGPASGWTKANCKLPVYEPDGALNRNGCHAAAGRLAGAGGGVEAPPDAKKAAARRLVGLYRSDLKEDPPDSLLSLAR